MPWTRETPLPPKSRVRFEEFKAEGTSIKLSGV